MLHVLYLVHDLADPAVSRRVTMLQAGGAEVTLAGFRRSQNTLVNFDTPPIELGVTRDGKFAQRLAAVSKAALALRRKLKNVAKPDIIIGRNLEMLALANRAKSLFGGDTPIVYECLDIHRLLLREDWVGKAMRGAERALGKNVALLVTSSPAFVRNYFLRFCQIDAPVALLENKVLELTESPVSTQISGAAAGEPWKIGWFGALRCRRSLELLAAFTRKMEGRFEVVLRGRPAYSEFTDFDGFVASEPYLRFEGAYRNPQDLAEIYGEVHFVWAIDFFEEGLNSSWLLPNRLYEGCRYGAVPIAMRQTETGRFLADRHLGVLLNQPSPEGLAASLAEIDPEEYTASRQKILAEDRANWVCDIHDCRMLVERLTALRPTTLPQPVLQAA